MFEEMLGIQKQSNNEERMLDKQLNAGQQQAILEGAVSPQADMTYLEQTREREDLVKWQQDLQSELTALELDLKRKYIENGELKSLLDEDNMPLKPACNEKCIQMIRTECRPLLSRNMIMSNFSEERILQILKRTMASVIRNITAKFDYYDIEFLDISYIIATIKNYVMPAPFRSMNNGERRHLDTINRRIETYSATPQQQEKKKILGLFG